MSDPGPPYSDPQPVLRTERLVLRPFTPDDAPEVGRLLADAAIARNTLTIPHPYPEGAAEEFIAAQAPAWAAGKKITWAVTRMLEGALVGAISLQLARPHKRCEVGYWIARSEWGQKFATEATRCVVAYAFDVLQMHRVEAHHFVENPSSGRVMEHVGMQPEGVHRGVVWRDGVPRDLKSYGILRTDPRR
jgi:ribosomal-protein-alanine N-acetyltransferase